MYYTPFVTISECVVQTKKTLQTVVHDHDLWKEEPFFHIEYSMCKWFRICSSSKPGASRMKHIAVVAYTRARGAGSHTPFLLVGNTHHAQCPIFTFFSPQPMYGTWYFFILFYTLVHNSHTLFMNKKKVHRPPTTSTFVIR